MKNTEKKTMLDYLAEIGAWVLGGAMFIYLGFRTLDFLTFTFREDDVFFAYLGLFSTTIGAVIFALIWSRSFYFDRRNKVWRSDELRKTISMSMMIVCALGELFLAVADMSLVTAEKGAVLTLSEGDLKLFMWLTAGLAALVGISIATIKLSHRHPDTDPIIDMSKFDGDNNGILDRNEPVKSRRQFADQSPAPELKPRKIWELDEFLDELGFTMAEAKQDVKKAKNPDIFYNMLKAYGIEEKIDISRKNFARLFDELKGNPQKPPRVQ